MNRQKLATHVCIVLSIACSLSFGLLIYFKVFLPIVSNTYEKILYYPETLYGEYREEAERMIAENDYISQYHAKTTIYSESGRTNLVIEIGEDYKRYKHSNYITATVKNFGTNDQEVTFERSRKSAEEELKEAEAYKTKMNRSFRVFVVLLIIFTGYLIKRSIEKRYLPAFVTTIIYIIVRICIVYYVV